MNYKKKLKYLENNDCTFCRGHEVGDCLYEPSEWDGGIGFDYIESIKFCPLCGKPLYDPEKED